MAGRPRRGGESAPKLCHAFEPQAHGAMGPAGVRGGAGSGVGGRGGRAVRARGGRGGARRSRGCAATRTVGRLSRRFTSHAAAAWAAIPCLSKCTYPALLVIRPYSKPSYPPGPVRGPVRAQASASARRWTARRAWARAWRPPRPRWRPRATSGASATPRRRPRRRRRPPRAAPRSGCSRRGPRSKTLENPQPRWCPSCARAVSTGQDAACPEGCRRCGPPPRRDPAPRAPARRWRRRRRLRRARPPTHGARRPPRPPTKLPRCVRHLRTRTRARPRPRVRHRRCRRRCRHRPAGAGRRRRRWPDLVRGLGRACRGCLFLCMRARPCEGPLLGLERRACGQSSRDLRAPSQTREKIV